MFKKWSSHYANLISCGLYVGLLLAGVFSESLSDAIIRQGLLGLICIAIFAFAFNLWRYLAIAKAPISSISAAAQGYVELNGIALKEPPIHSPLHGEPCVWYRSWAYARDHKNFWRLVSYSQSKDVFTLEDDSGTCTVNPQGAEVIHMLKRTSYKHNHRYVEEYLPANASLYLIGHLDTRHHHVDEKTIHQHMGKLISGWKANPAQMLLRFDLDRNGEIDQQEWEKARAQASTEVMQVHMNQAHIGDYEISKPDNGALYLLSGMSPEILRKGYRNWVVMHLIVLITLLIIGRFV